MMKDSKYFNNKTFVEMFVHPAMNLLSGTIEPRITKEIRRIMHLTDQVRVCDWYL